MGYGPTRLEYQSSTFPGAPLTRRSSVSQLTSDEPSSAKELEKGSVPVEGSLAKRVSLVLGSACTHSAIQCSPS